MKKVLFLVLVSAICFGAKLKLKTMTWTPDEQAVKFHVYCAIDGAVDYDDPFVELTVPSLKLEPGVCGLADGQNYLLAVSQFDAYGHESDLSPEGGISLAADFSPLPAPTNVVIE